MNYDLDKAWQAIQGIQKLSRDPEIRTLAKEAEQRIQDFWGAFLRRNQLEAERLQREAEFEAGCG